MIKLTNEDNMALMARYPDKYFDLAIVDPPYGIGYDGAKKTSGSHGGRKAHDFKCWDSKRPNKKYWDELFRISKNQIIWGGNYFFDYLSNTQGFIVWDKKQPEKFSLAMCEFAYSSIQSPAKIFRLSVLSEQNKIHPTQKPVALYKWLLTNYAKQGDKILDTHLGSQSSRIAAYDLGFDFWGCELDKDYFEQGNKRFEQYKSQQKLF